MAQKFLDDLPEVDLTAHHRVRETDIDPEATVQKLKVKPDFLKVQCPARVVVCGPTEVGKTHFILRMLEHRDSVFNKPIDFINVHLPANSIQDYVRFKTALLEVCGDVPICFKEGLPKRDAIVNKNGAHQIYIFDDVMNDFFNSSDMEKLIIKDSHHKNITVIVTTQNYFARGQAYRTTILKNSSILVYFYDRTDTLSTNRVSSKLFGKTAFLTSIFNWLKKNTKLANGSRYVVIETSQNSELADRMQVRTNIFPTKQPSGAMDVSPLFFLV